MLTTSAAIHGLGTCGMDLMARHRVAACCTGMFIANVVAMLPTIINIVGPLLVFYWVGSGVGLLCGCLSLGHHTEYHHGLLWLLWHVSVKV